MTVKRPPPHTSDSNHLHNHANRARKSWRSDVLIILPGWERQTGGSRSIPTVHPCGLRSGGCGSSSNHKHVTSPIVKPYGRVKSAKKVEIFIIPIACGTAKLLGRDRQIRESPLRQYEPVRSEDLSEELQRSSNEPQTAETKKRTLKPATTSGRLQETLLIVITLNLEFTSMYRKKNYSQYH